MCSMCKKRPHLDDRDQCAECLEEYIRAMWGAPFLYSDLRSVYVQWDAYKAETLFPDAIELLIKRAFFSGMVAMNRHRAHIATVCKPEDFDEVLHCSMCDIETEFLMLAIWDEDDLEQYKREHGEEL